MTPTATEIDIAKKYARMTGLLPTGLVDVLRILTSPDMLPLLKKYINEINDAEKRA